jgi:hypothetical protein
VDAHVERYVIAARLKPGGATAAEQTLLAGPPFDPAEAGLSAHAAYLTNDSVYLVFEGEAAHVKALQLARKHLADVSHWQSIVSDLPSRVEDVPEMTLAVSTTGRLKPRRNHARTRRSLLQRLRRVPRFPDERLSSRSYDP